MAIVTNTFQRYVKHVTSAMTISDVLISGVPANTDMTVMGLIVTNTFDSPTNTPLTADVILKYNGAGPGYYLIKNGRIPEGESLIVIGWDQKLVLKPTDDISILPKPETTVTSVTASFTATTITRADGKSWTSVGGVKAGTVLTVAGTGDANSRIVTVTSVSGANDSIITVPAGGAILGATSATFTAQNATTADVVMSVLEIKTTA
jgi:hypothetical protein